MLGESSQVTIISVKILGPLACRPFDLSSAHTWLDRTYDVRCDLVLKIKDIIHGAIVPFGPDVCAGGCIDELSGNAYARARLPHAALEDIANVESFCDLAHINVLTLELEGRCPRSNKEPAQPRQSRDELLNNTVADMNADAEFDALVLRYSCITLHHAALDLNRTACSVHGTCKLNQYAIAGPLDDTAAMICNLWL